MILFNDLPRLHLLAATICSNSVFKHFAQRLLQSSFQRLGSGISCFKGLVRRLFQWFHSKILLKGVFHILISKMLLTSLFFQNYCSNTLYYLQRLCLNIAFNYFSMIWFSDFVNKNKWMTSSNICLVLARSAARAYAQNGASVSTSWGLPVPCVALVSSASPCRLQFRRGTPNNCWNKGYISL